MSGSVVGPGPCCRRSIRIIEGIANLNRVALAAGGVGTLLAIGRYGCDYINSPNTNLTPPIDDGTLSTTEWISIYIFLLAAAALVLLLGLINVLNR
jgi:hypothetical protein